MLRSYINLTLSGYIVREKEMVWHCSCRQIPGSKVEKYLKAKSGELVTLKELVNECSGNNGACCSQSKNCMGGLREIVKDHNATLNANDDNRPPATVPALG